MITLRNKIGQMLIMGFNGTEINDQSPVAQWLSRDGLGGVLLFDKDLATNSYGKNLKNQSQIKQLLKQLNEYATTGASELPLLTAIDYEGGAIDRLTKIEGCRATITASQLAQLSEDAREQEIHQMALTLKNLGFNLNFAPVVDLNLNADEGIIGKLDRSFSENPEKVISVAQHFVDVFNRHGIICSYKHFPGHGSATGDTHEGFVDVTNTFHSEELLPYQHLLTTADQPIMVMTAHVINKHLDSSGLPATLSYEILTGLLRENMGYKGIIISDDLQMQAISNHYTLDETLCLTIKAGADMMIFGNQLGTHDAAEVIDIIERLVIEKKISQQRIDEAYNRIVALKQHVYCSELVN